MIKKTEPYLSIATLFILSLFGAGKAVGSDTLYFRLSNPFNTVKDPSGNYLRKCVQEKDYYHVWDFNSKNRLVTESYYSDTSFKKKLFCHKYYNEEGGWLEQTRCYEDGRLNGYFVDYNKQGDTVDYAIYQSGSLLKSWSLHPANKDSVSVSDDMLSSEVRAECPGGEQGWSAYLSKNLRYPSKMVDAGVTGQVILQFTVTPTGTIENIVVLQSLDPLFDKEAIRVVAKSPKWIPAEQLGKKIKAVITQPFNF